MVFQFNQAQKTPYEQWLEQQLQQRQAAQPPAGSSPFQLTGQPMQPPAGGQYQPPMGNAPIWYSAGGTANGWQNLTADTPPAATSPWNPATQQNPNAKPGEPGWGGSVDYTADALAAQKMGQQNKSGTDAIFGPYAAEGGGGAAQQAANAPAWTTRTAGKDGSSYYNVLKGKFDPWGNW